MPYVLPPDEVPLYYEEAGQGKNILLIHGGAASTKFWKRQIPELSRRFHMVSIDLRGHGNSGKTNEGINLIQYGQDLAHLLKTLELDDVVVVGWSLGTSVVLSYIRQFGVERLAGFVNVDQGRAPFTTEEGLQERIAGLRTQKFRTHRQHLESFLSTPQLEEDLVWMTCDMMKTPTEVYISIMEDSYRSNFRPMWGDVTVPTLICRASQGMINSELAQSMVEAMPKARVVVFDNCGHMLFWEQPEKFNRELTAFVEEVTE